MFYRSGAAVSAHRVCTCCGVHQQQRRGRAGSLRTLRSTRPLMGCAVLQTCRRRDPDAWTHADGRAHYSVSSPVPASTQLVQQLLAACGDQVRRQQQQRQLRLVSSSSSPACGMQPVAQARLRGQRLLPHARPTLHLSAGLQLAAMWGGGCRWWQVASWRAMCCSVFVCCAPQVGQDLVVQGLNATADSFYSSQVSTVRHSSHVSLHLGSDRCPGSPCGTSSLEAPLLL